MGIQIRDIDGDLADKVGITNLRGVYISGVTDDGSAKAAGIETGDIITSIDNTPVNSTSELLEIIGTKRPGDQVMVTVNRDNKEKYFQLVLKNKNGTTGIVKKEEVDIAYALGAKFEPITSSEKSKYRLEYGLKIVELQRGKLSDAGIQQGFIVTRIDKQPMKNLSDLKEALSSGSDGILIEGVYPDGIRAYYGIGL
jgi:S1-C subfamily serine protease